MHCYITTHIKQVKRRQVSERATVKFYLFPFSPQKIPFFLHNLEK